MPPAPTAAVTEMAELLARVNAEEPGAQDALFAAAYPELRRLAQSRLQRGGRSTLLNTTVLVHESYLRAVESGGLKPASRSAFFAYAARTMRSVVIDGLRQRQAQRRGGGATHLALTTGLEAHLGAPEDEVLRVDEALQALAAEAPRLAQVVEMRYFGGYTEALIAQALGVTERTVQRDWEKARLLLMALLK